MTKIDIIRLLGASQQTTSHKEKFISFLGGFLSIYIIYLITRQLLGVADAVYIIPSMGATAVLLFAAPNVPFSQPWNVFGGHIISAFIGVACYQLMPDIHVAAAASVGLAIWAQYYARCIHPPGGATALAAVIGSSQIHDLSYLYIITPVLINTIVMIIIAIAINALFSWRSYPAALSKSAAAQDDDPYSPINHEDFVYALSQIDSIVDISEADLVKIYSLATMHSNTK
ncbi:MAG: HPP family protein [Cocleimonas sp.]|nr:HPP family protein [Cocleimonas sp.]